MNQNSEKKMTIVDVRTPGEFFSAHADGAVNIPLNELPSKLDYLRSIEGTIVLCCASGGRSASATTFLVQNGFSNVTNAGPWYVAQNMLVG